MAILPTRATLLCTRIADLQEWGLVITCDCRGLPRHLAVSALSAEWGGRLTLEGVLVRLRCENCGLAPVRIEAKRRVPLAARGTAVVLLESRASDPQRSHTL